MRVEMEIMPSSNSPWTSSVYSLRLALLSSIGVAGCNVADFDITQDIAEQRAQGSPLPGPLALLFPLPLNIDIGAEIAARTTGPVDSVTLSALTLTITPTAEPAGDVDDWSFVDQIDVFISSSKSGSTLPRTRIAHVTLPGAVETLTFAIELDVNLKPYIEEGGRVQGETTARVPQDDVTYDGEGVFSVHPL